MSYTVNDLERAMSDGWEDAADRDNPYTPEDGDLWELIKYEDVRHAQTDVGMVSYAASYGGEGQGDDYWVVVRVTGLDMSTRFFRKDGYYQSYSGGTLDGDVYEVRPVEKLVTFYE